MKHSMNRSFTIRMLPGNPDRWNFVFCGYNFRQFPATRVRVWVQEQLSKSNSGREFRRNPAIKHPIPALIPAHSSAFSPDFLPFYFVSAMKIYYFELVIYYLAHFNSPPISSHSLVT